MNRTEPITETLSRNTVLIFQEKNTKTKSKQKKLISQTLTCTITDKEIVAAVVNHVISDTIADTTGLTPCNHEEAYTSIIVHLTDVFQRGFSKLKICTVDTDVVVLAIASVPNQADGTEVWIAFGTGKDFCYIPTHIILKYLGPMKSLSLPMFHSFTGCNSFSLSKYWKIWELNDEIKRKFYELH